MTTFRSISAGFGTTIADNLSATQVDNNFLELNKRAVSVKDFSAVGDGVTDDTTAIQNCLNYCLTNELDMFIPSGTYYITSTITSDDCRFINIIGEGKAGYMGNSSATVLETDQDITVLKLSNSNNSGWSGVNLKNIQLNHSNQNSTTASSIGLYLNLMAGFTIENCSSSRFKNGTGLYLDAGGGSTQYGTFINWHSYNCKFGIYKIGNCTDLNFFGGKLHGIDGGVATVGSYGFYEAQSPYATSSGRINFYGIGINDLANGMYIQELRHSYIRCTIEQSVNNADTGTAIEIASTGTGNEGYNNILESHIAKWDTGVKISAGALYTVVRCSFANMPTISKEIVDSGSHTNVMNYWGSALIKEETDESAKVSSGFAKLFIDTSSEDLKIRYSDGTVGTIFTKP